MNTSNVSIALVKLFELQLFSNRDTNIPNKHPTFHVTAKENKRNTFDLDATCTRKNVQVYGVVSV